MASAQNSDDVVIRGLSIEDYQDVSALWRKASLAHRPDGRDSRARIESQLRQANCIFLVAEVTGRLVGTVLGTHDGRKGWINRLAVDPEWQRQGIGRRLVTEFEDRLSRLSIDVIGCLIEDGNTASMEAFERLGYSRAPDIAYFSKRSSPEA